MERLYADANATVPPSPAVRAAVAEAMASHWGNPTSIHREGQRARHLLEQARERIAAELGVPPGELVFCSGATEGMHLLLRGLQPALGRRALAVFPGEHSACLNSLRDWPGLCWLPEIPEGVALLVQMSANNETGILYGMPRAPGALRVRDAVQAWGKVTLDLGDCDAAVLSGHKIGAPRGVGVLWMRPGLPWASPMEGPQEARRRGGTEDLPAILGLAAAVRELPERLEGNARLAPLRDALEAELLGWDADYEVIGRGLPRLPNTSCLLLRGHHGQAVLAALDLEGIAVSTGSACHSGAVKPSHAITTLGYSETEARSVVRVSFLPSADAADLERLLQALGKVLRKRARGEAESS
ncbi:MAG: aminotransferase class V-fold PLP-dependent enzyme [Acidobacteria bacterium]|nr:aminotransferase class V-fold PLP-dependent enzyme [Acidobacteriota bacterium]